MYLSQRVIITCRDAISVIGLATNRGRMAFDGGGESATQSGSLIHNGIFLSQAAIYEIKSALILAEVDGVCQTKMSQVDFQRILTHKSKAVVNPATSPIQTSHTPFSLSPNNPLSFRCIDKWFEVNRSCPEHPSD
jgi:hypothetical protein